MPASTNLPNEWNVDPKDAVAIQRELAAKIDIKTHLGNYATLAAVDVSCNLRGDQIFAAIVVFDRQHNIIERSSVIEPLTFPYIPGLLSFREIPALLKAHKNLRRKPDVILVDGHGIAHPRRMGIAAHLGVCLNLPTVGCGKSRLCGEYDEPGQARGDKSEIIHRGEIVGYALRTRPKVKPVLISPGHLCTFEDAIELVLNWTSRYRLPDPIREAHRYANEVRVEANTARGLLAGESAHTGMGALPSD